MNERASLPAVLSVALFALALGACAKSRGDPCAADSDCRKGLRCAELTGVAGKKVCSDAVVSPEKAQAEAVESVRRAERLHPESRERMRATVSGAFAAVFEPQGSKCYVLKRGAIGLYTVLSRFVAGQPQLPEGAPPELLQNLPACAAAPR